MKLVKWYLDLVTPEGTALIAYAAFLRWGVIRIHYASTLLVHPGSTPREETAWSGVVPPHRDSEGVVFDHRGLGLHGEWRSVAEPVAATLLDGVAGRLQWDCMIPSATVTARLRGEPMEGRGYVECLTMTCPPQALPLRTLRWGRFTSEHHAVVWIGWQGGPPRQWVWLDGTPQPDARIGDSEIGGMSEGATLDLTPVRELCDRRALQVLSRRLPALDSIPLGPLKNLRETKRLAQGTLRLGSEPEDRGWALHERVTW
jgi:hypothetical protein